MIVLLLLCQIFAADFGVDGIGDDSRALQACFEAAVEGGQDVVLPPIAFRASAAIRCDAHRIPNISGAGIKTQWFPGREPWALTIDAERTNYGKNISIEGVSFRDSFLANQKSGLRINASSGPVAIRNCDFRYLKVGLAFNGTYGVHLDSCEFQSNNIGLLNTVRKASNPIEVLGQEITFSDPVHLQHSGICQLTNCTFSSNTVGWLVEDPDLAVGSPAQSYLASTSIFQGRGVGVWTRGIDTPAAAPGIAFHNCHWECTQSPPDKVEIDGETVNCGDAVLGRGKVLFQNGSPRGLTQLDGSYCQAVGISNLPRIFHSMTKSALFEADTLAGVGEASTQAISQVVLPDHSGVFSRSHQKQRGGQLGAVKVLNAFSGKPNSLPVKWGLGVRLESKDGACIVETTQPNTGVRTNGHAPSGYWYYSFSLRAEEPIEIALVNYGSVVQATIPVDENWRTYHGAATFDKPSSFIRLWTPTPGRFEIRDFQLVQAENMTDIVEYQRRGVFAGDTE